MYAILPEYQLTHEVMWFVTQHLT